MFFTVGKNITFAALWLLCCFVQAAVLECPANAPPEWKLARARLDRVRVSGPSAEGLPEREWLTGGMLFQAWNMKPAARRPVAYQVDCLYTGTTRFIRFDARSTGRCVAKRRVREGGVMSGSMEFRCR